MSVCPPIYTVCRRTMSMLSQRHSLIESRRESAAKAKLQKETITRIMDQVRGNAAKASKVVQLVQDGKVTLDSIIGPNSILLSPNRHPKKSSTASKSTSELLNMNRASQSAGVPIAATGFDSGYPETKAEEPVAYVSPYEIGFTDTGNKPRTAEQN